MIVYIHSMFVFFIFVLPGARWRLELCSSKFRQEEEQKTSKKNEGGGNKRYLCCHTLIHIIRPFDTKHTWNCAYVKYTNCV